MTRPPLNTGDTAPNFELHDHTGAPRSLESLLAAGPLVLYFYPADFTPVCTAEACSFRDAHGPLAAAGLTLAGISPQSADSHARFAARHELPFPLLADPDRRVIAAYGCLGPLGLFTRRVTYLIATDRRVLDRLEANLAVGPHRRFLQRAIEASARPIDTARTPHGS